MVGRRHCWFGFWPRVACRFCFEFDFVLFMEWRGALPKLHHLRTSPKLHMLRTARATHQNHQIARDPNQRTWRTLNTYVFARTLCLEIKSAYNPNFYYFRRIKWFRQCCCKKLENKTAQQETIQKWHYLWRKQKKRGKIWEKGWKCWEDEIDRGAHHPGSANILTILGHVNYHAWIAATWNL